MLRFWYSCSCTRQVRLIICISTCTLILLCAEASKLATLFTLQCLGVGALIDLLYRVSRRRDQENPVRHGFTIAFRLLPIIAFPLLLIQIDFTDLSQGLAELVQCIGFVAVGFMVLSTATHRAKRHG